MKETELSYPSADGHSTIRAWLWEPTGAANKRESPRALIQIVHGVAEYSGRYQQFVKYFVSQGFAVCSEDHIGHGLSVASAAELGHMPLHKGADALIADVHSLRQLVQDRYETSLPYVLLGHSMGSFIVRCYLAEHGKGVIAAICSGTAQTPALTSFFGNRLAHLIAAIKGPEYRSDLLHKFGLGAYSKKVKNRRTDLDWLCTDPEVVDAYIADPLCGARLTAGGYATLTQLTQRMVAATTLAYVPKKLRLLIISGKNDPVGNMGAGPNQAFKAYNRVDIEFVDLKIFAQARHEILNEPNKRSVYNTIISWLELRLGV